MADDLQASKQEHHAALASEHRRKAEFHEQHAGGMSANVPGSNKSAGSQMGDLVGALGAHKFIIIGGIAVVIVVIIAMNIINNNNNTQNTANQSPDLSQGGYVPSNIATSLDNINAQLSALSQQNQSNTGTTTTTSKSTIPINMQWQNCQAGQLCPWGTTRTYIPAIQSSTSSSLQSGALRGVTILPRSMSNQTGITGKGLSALTRAENIMPNVKR